MKRSQKIALAAVLSAAASTSLGCSGVLARIAVHTESGLRAGNEGWQGVYDTKLADCKAQGLETKKERQKCFGKTQAIDDKVGKSIETGVAVLRTFWIAYAAGKSPKEMRGFLGELGGVVEALPAEYFGGIQKQLKRY